MKNLTTRHTFICGWTLAALSAFVAMPCANSAEIKGRVTDAVTGAAIANASVGISTPQFSPEYGQSTATGSNGRYLMDIPFAGSFELDVEADGYARFRDFVNIPDSPPLIDDIQLNPSASISGTVRANGSQALANVTVSLLDTQTLHTLQVAQTDASGSYTFNSLNPGTYTTCVFDSTDAYVDTCYDQKPVTANGTIHFTTVDVVVGKNVKHIDIALMQGASISGILRDTFFGLPIADTTMSMTLYTAANVPLYTRDVDIDTNGRYVLAGLPQGTYFVSAARASFANTEGYPTTLFGSGECGPSSCTFSAAARIAVSGTGTTNADIDLFPLNVVEGTITDADTHLPLAGVTVIASYYESTITDANGRYVIAHIPSTGSSIATSHAPGYIDQLWGGTPCLPKLCFETSTNDFITFSAPDQILTGIDIALHRGATISGRVTASEHSDVPIPNALIDLWYDGPYFSPFQELLTDANGEYQSDGWTGGTFYAVALNLGAPYGCALYLNTSCAYSSYEFIPYYGTPIYETAGQSVTGIDFQFNTETIFKNGFD